MSLLGAIGSGAEARRAAAKNRKFQKHMYKNRYRYTMADMKRSGLNPILAAGSGLGGGSSPSGSVVTGGDPNVGSEISTAMDYKRTHQEGKLKKQQRSQLAMQEKQAAAQAGLFNAQTQKALSEAIQIRQQTAIDKGKLPRAEGITTAYDTVGRPIVDAMPRAKSGLDHLYNTAKDLLQGSPNNMLRDLIVPRKFDPNQKYDRQGNPLPSAKQKAKAKTKSNYRARQRKRNRTRRGQ